MPAVVAMDEKSRPTMGVSPGQGCQDHDVWPMGGRVVRRTDLVVSSRDWSDISHELQLGVIPSGPGTGVTHPYAYIIFAKVASRLAKRPHGCGAPLI